MNRRLMSTATSIARLSVVPRIIARIIVGRTPPRLIIDGTIIGSREVRRRSTPRRSAARRNIQLRRIQRRLRVQPSVRRRPNTRLVKTRVPNLRDRNVVRSRRASSRAP
jgi:hypothetical protein